MTPIALHDTLSVLGKKWIERPHDARDALAISQQLGVPEIIGRILAGRGVKPHEAGSFLQPTLRETLPDPFHLKDMRKAASRIGECLQSRSPIAIFGDYDVDGATSSALLVRYFRTFGCEPLVHIPDRITEGYGPNAPALLSLKERGAKVVITVDCGTMAFEPLAAAKEAGIEIIVVDHHKGELRMPETYALVNPNRADETSPHIQLAACGVTFLLMVAVNRLMKEAGTPVPDLMQWLDLVALGTICDVVPLTGVNRALVTQGLKVMAARGNTGIKTAMDMAGLMETPNTYHAGFIIGPRINAGGRVGKPDLGVRLLTTQEEGEAHAIAGELNRFNDERKAIEALVQEDAMKQAVQLPETDAVIIVGHESWHPGVIGIVAGRLKDHFGKPTAVIAIKDGVGKSSARSIAGIDLGAEVIAACAEGVLMGGGGHAMAAGFSIASDAIPRLRAFFNHRLAKKVNELSREKLLHIDGAISLRGVTTEFVRIVEKAGPFGSGNHPVRLMLHKARIVRADVLGGAHVRVILTDSRETSPSLKGMAFRSLGTPLGDALLGASGKTLDVAGQAKINHWQGRETVDFVIDDVSFR